MLGREDLWSSSGKLRVSQNTLPGPISLQGPFPATHLSETCGGLIAKLCLTLNDPMDCSSLGSSVHGILQARILEWVAICSPGDLPDPGINPGSPALQADSLPTELRGKLKHNLRFSH